MLIKKGKSQLFRKMGEGRGQKSLISAHCLKTVAGFLNSVHSQPNHGSHLTFTLESQQSYAQQNPQSRVSAAQPISSGFL